MKTTKTEKLYCYVDETGQDTMGRWFLVVVVIVAEEKDKIEEKLLAIERQSGKYKTKWHKSKFPSRQKYIDGIKKIKELNNSFYYSTYQNTTLFTDLLALTTAKAVLNRAGDNYSTSITVDGLTRNLEMQFAALLRKLKIKTGKVKGARDESSSLVRLADAMAGLLRDACENQSWAKKSVDQLNNRKFFHEI
ncbi:MAG: DUF3800 domain-containing protein [Candidatus Berkelbacteria bacterium]|nr:DUF3800 domain-containing protein [Candidatus Berkelbacteria bacterium]